MEYGKFRTYLRKEIIKLLKLLGVLLFFATFATDK